jgi:hypothetical protein
MYIMVQGKMMKLVPMTKDVKLKNGCQVCTGCQVKDAKGKATKLKNGDMVSAEGKVMKPAALSLHGG